mgnify:CR=1 FL=1
MPLPLQPYFRPFSFLNVAQLTLKRRKSSTSVHWRKGFVAFSRPTVELGLAPLPALGGLVIGGVIAAPFGALLARRIPAPALMAAVGLLVCALAAWQIAKGFGWA